MGQKLRKFYANLRRFECSDEETNKLPDDKCSFCIHQFVDQLLGSTTNISECKENSSAVKDRSRGAEVKCVSRKINSWVFCLNLSSRADVYNVYGIFSNICQEVNLLPHERLDRVQDVIAIFLKIMKTLDHSDCP